MTGERSRLDGRALQLVVPLRPRIYGTGHGRLPLPQGVGGRFPIGRRTAAIDPPPCGTTARRVGFHWQMGGSVGMYHCVPMIVAPWRSPKWYDAQTAK